MNRELIYNSPVHFADALLDDCFVDYHPRRFIAKYDKTGRYQQRTDAAMPVVLALYRIYMGKWTGEDIALLRDHMEARITQFLIDEELDEAA